MDFPLEFMSKIPSGRLWFAWLGFALVSLIRRDEKILARRCYLEEIGWDSVFWKSKVWLVLLIVAGA